MFSFMSVGSFRSEGRSASGFDAGKSDLPMPPI